MRAILSLTLLLAALVTPLAARLNAAETGYATPGDVPIVPAEWQPLHDRWQAAMRELNAPGLAVVAVRGREVVLLDALGVCDPDGKQNVVPRSPFYLASVTKSFTALGIAVLVEEGKVKLDDPVRTYLPRFTLHDQELAAKLTVRDLLSHRYGLDSPYISRAEAYLGNINDDRYYHLLAAVRPLGKFAYSNLHFTLAGRVIEAVSGKRWQDFLAERVFAPLEMRDSTCYASQLFANPLAARPIVERDGRWLLSPVIKTDSVMHAAGGMGSSAVDLANWLRFQLTGYTPDGRRLISKELLAEVHTRWADDPERDSLPGVKSEGYSLGWFTGRLNDHPVLWHGGGYVGTTTLVAFLPQDNVGLAVLMNESSPSGMLTMAVAQEVAAKLLGTTAPDMLPEVRAGAERSRQRMKSAPQRDWNPPTAASGLVHPLANYPGTYANRAWGEMIVTAESDALRFQIGTAQLRCHALGEDRYELEIPPNEVTKGRFKSNEAGQVQTLTIKTPLGDAEFDRVR
jgi:CubicO group peptidase (beta-lactamase class C family)